MVDPHDPAAVLTLLEKAVAESGGAVRYDHQDDEVGEYVCCGETSYKEHKPGCWYIDAERVIAVLRGKK
jgi:hypothetical protein